MAKKIIGVYKITNTITGDFYIGSSKNVKHRWSDHKIPSTWKNNPNNPMYLDMKRYGLCYFVFEILAEVEVTHLKETEQQFIEILKPTYNDRNADGWDFERYKEHQREYYQQNREKQIEHQIEYYQQNRKKRQEYQKEYGNQLCFYSGQTMTLNALRLRFRKAGLSNPTTEAKKYLIRSSND